MTKLQSIAEPANGSTNGARSRKVANGWGSMARPFFKLAGGKFRHVRTITKLMPKDFESYCEPCVGSGAIFLALRSFGFLDHRVGETADTAETIPMPAILNDADQHIMLAWNECQLSTSHDALRAALQSHENEYNTGTGHRHWWECLDIWDHDEEGTRTADLFIFLVQMAASGVWKYCQDLKLEMSCGSFRHCEYDFDNFDKAQEMMTHTKFTIGQAWDVIPAPGSFIYVDPPNRGGFTTYFPSEFTAYHQQRTIEWCATQSRNGQKMLYQQNDCAEVRKWLGDIWPKARLFVVPQRNAGTDIIAIDGYDLEEAIQSSP